MVVYLAADEARMDELDRAVRDYLGWSDVLAKQDELDLTRTRRTRRRRSGARRATPSNRGCSAPTNGRWSPRASRWDRCDEGRRTGHVPRRAGVQPPWQRRRALHPTGGRGDPSRPQHATPLWEDGHVTVGDLWQLYAGTPTCRGSAIVGFPRRPAAGPLLWEQDGFALADGFDAEAKRYRGLVLPSDEQQIKITDGTLIVRPRAGDGATRRGAEPQRPETPRRPAATRPSLTPQAPMPAPKFRRPSRGRKKRASSGADGFSSERYAKDFKNVADGVLAHLTSIPGAKVKISLEIEAVAPDGFDESQIRVVSENAATLKFEQSRFENFRPTCRGSLGLKGMSEVRRVPVRNLAIHSARAGNDGWGIAGSADLVRRGR